MKTRYILLVTALISPILIVAVLFYLSDKPNQEKNGFNRIWSRRQLVKLKELKTSGLFTRVVGFYGDTIFFNQMKPFVFYSTDLNLVPQRELSASYDSMQYLTASYSVSFRYPNMFVMAGNIPGVVQQNFFTGHNRKFWLPARYTRSALISSTTIVVRAFDSSGSNRIFRKINLLTGRTAVEIAATERYNDGGFVTDGQLNYDPASGHLFYVYFYSNEFICMDTNLNVIYRGHTIDTIRTRNFPVASDIKHQSFTPAVPLHFVNLSSFAGQGKLFVLSSLKADNESDNQFTTASAIDVYDARDGHYLFSILVPRAPDDKIKSFTVHDSMLLVVYNKKIMTYKLESTRL